MFFAVHFETTTQCFVIITKNAETFDIFKNQEDLKQLQASAFQSFP